MFYQKLKNEIINWKKFTVDTTNPGWESNPCHLLFLQLGFLSRTFTIHRTAGEGGGYLFKSSLPLPLSSQTLRHQSGDYCRELTSAHSQNPDSNQELLVTECKSLTTKLRATFRYYTTRPPRSARYCQYSLNEHISECLYNIYEYFSLQNN